MIVGIDVRCLSVAKTGVRTYVECLLDALPRVAPEHTFIQFAPSHPPRAGSSAVEKILNHLSHLWWTQVVLPVRAKRAHCDVLFSPEYMAPFFCPCKSVVVFFDANFWVNPQQYNRWWRMIQNLFAVPAARRADLVLTISEAARHELLHYLNFREGRVVSIPLAPQSHATQLVSSTQQTRNLSRYGLDGIPFVLHVGVLEVRKNLPRLIEAFCLLKQRLREPYQLVLVGQPGPKTDLGDNSHIQETIERLGLADSVVLTGHVPGKELSMFYRGARLFVFPSLREGFGLPVLEAFANGVPVVASNATAIPEVAGDAALLVDSTDVQALCDAMYQVLTGVALRGDLIRRGYERVKQFSWERTARETIRVLEQVARDCQQSRPAH